MLLSAVDDSAYNALKSIHILLAIVAVPVLVILNAAPARGADRRLTAAVAILQVLIFVAAAAGFFWLVGPVLRAQEQVGRWLAIAVIGTLGTFFALIGIAVFSHFILDVPVHTPDLPLAWRGTPKIGLGLWNHRAVALALELIALGAGLFLYVRGRTQLRARFWIFAVTLVAVALSTPFMPPPASPAAFAVQALSAYLALAVWAGWVEQPDRPPQPSH